MTKDTHFPIWISFLDSIIGKDLFELESVFRQCDIIRLWIPFFKTSEFVTISKLLNEQSTTIQDIQVRIPSFENITTSQSWPFN
jgi:hypothetical protein